MTLKYVHSSQIKWQSFRVGCCLFTCKGKESKTFVAVTQIDILFYIDLFQRWFPVCSARSLVCVFLSSCKKSQNVYISQLLRWGKFRVSKQPLLWVRRGRGWYFVSPHVTWRNNLPAVKVNEAVGKIIWKASKISAIWYVTSNIYSHSIEWELMFINIRGAETAQYWLEIIFKKCLKSFGKLNFLLN